MKSQLGRLGYLDMTQMAKTDVIWMPRSNLWFLNQRLSAAAWRFSMGLLSVLDFSTTQWLHSKMESKAEGPRGLRSPRLLWPGLDVRPASSCWAQQLIHSKFKSWRCNPMSWQGRKCYVRKRHVGWHVCCPHPGKTELPIQAILKRGKQVNTRKCSKQLKHILKGRVLYS